MHAAVIAINKAIDKEDASELLTVLQNPASLLTNIHPSIIDQYQKYLSSSKLEKATNTQNKSSKADGNDVYDEMLTRAEIQNCLESINSRWK